jgi:predicted dienelactone hydrolase
MQSLLMVLLLGAGPAKADSVSAGAWELPPPSGEWRVGTRCVVLRDAARGRELPVTFWYPASNGGPPASYMDESTALALAREWNLQAGFERGVGTHSTFGAPLAANGQPFPVVLLEHGSSFVPALYTALAESLASQGFVVVASSHPPDALVTSFPDGRAIPFHPYWPADAGRRDQGMAIGRFAEDVLVGDVKFVLNQLERMNSRGGVWEHGLNLARIGIAGHSMGGTTAALAGRLEPRIVAAVNLDGSTYPGMNADVRPVEVRKPFLFLATEEHALDPETHAHEFLGSASSTYYAVVRGADHLSFSDANLLSSRSSASAPPDEGKAQSAISILEAVRLLVEEFFGKYLRGAPAPHLDSIIRVERR